jgi:hypothetical protein
LHIVRFIYLPYFTPYKTVLIIHNIMLRVQSTPQFTNTTQTHQTIRWVCSGISYM